MESVELAKNRSSGARTSCDTVPQTGDAAGEVVHHLVVVDGVEHRGGCRTPGPAGLRNVPAVERLPASVATRLDKSGVVETSNVTGPGTSDRANNTADPTVISPEPTTRSAATADVADSSTASTDTRTIALLAASCVPDAERPGSLAGRCSERMHRL